MAGLSVSGLVSGLDVDGLINQLMAVERQPIVNLQVKKSKLQAQADAWRDINTRLYNLQNKAYDLKQSYSFYSRTVSSTDETIASATASSSTALGTYALKVAQLAQAHVVASGKYASPNAGLGYSGSPTINGKAITIATTDTLNSIRDKINATAGIGVQASVVQVDATNYQLVLTKSTSGATEIAFVDNNAALTNLGILSGGVANTIQAAQDAQFSINGISVSRSTNTVSDVVPGLTINLKKAGTALSPLAVNLEVKNDSEKAVSAVQAYVDQYNSLMDFIADKAGYDSDKKVGGVLFGDAGVNLLQSSLRQSATASVPGLPATLNNLAQVGVTTGAYGSPDGKAGKLTFDAQKLRDMLDSNRDGVAQLFGAQQVNVALPTATNVTTVSASSTAAGSYDAADVTNGDTSAARFATPGGGWMGGTALDGTTTEYLTINFPTAKTVDQVRVFTLDSATYPAASYGLKDYKVQYWDGGTSTWKDAATVTSNTLGTVTSTFDAVSTTAVRLAITGTNATDKFARVLEFEAYQKNYGAAVRTYDLAYGYTKSGGIILSRQDGVNRQVDQIDNQIDRMEQRLTKHEETLRAQFTALETALSKMQSEGSYMAQQLSQLG
ncbi:MAG: flagellar filament capping protein FliD [Bacillota bacterium]